MDRSHPPRPWDSELELNLGWLRRRAGKAIPTPEMPEIAEDPAFKSLPALPPASMFCRKPRTDAALFPWAAALITDPGCPGTQNRGQAVISSSGPPSLMDGACLGAIPDPCWA